MNSRVSLASGIASILLPCQFRVSAMCLSSADVASSLLGADKENRSIECMVSAGCSRHQQDVSVQRHAEQFDRVETESAEGRKARREADMTRAMRSQYSMSMRECDSIMAQPLCEMRSKLRKTARSGGR